MSRRKRACEDRAGPRATNDPFDRISDADADARVRCPWCGDDPVYQAYHDLEWGFPVAEDRRLFEKLCLEGFQAGLSWITILRKRESFRRAFAGFDLDRIATWDERDVTRLLGDAGIVRHRGKIEAVIGNARQARSLREEWGSLAAFFWSFEPDPAERPRRLDAETLRSLDQTPASRALARSLKARGFRFVGPTTAYAFMQSMGIVNDHVEDCDVRARAESARGRFVRPSS
ncbi:MAG TPA: DNA-3-methyladenine glycosylase I [Myxococcota bacterium]|nr:DNA-3-methyladenine glycosylase I [Myxococcota bacterium]